MKTICIILLLLSFSSFGQELKGWVFDRIERPIEGVRVVNLTKQTTTLTDRLGIFTIAVNDGDSIMLAHPKKTTVFHKVSTPKKRDLIITFTLFDDESTQSIEYVDITSARIHSVLSSPEKDVIDFLPKKNGDVLVLNQFKKNYFLLLISDNSESKEFELLINKPIELYTDCFNNVHIIGRDSVYQISINNTLEYKEVLSLNQFNEKIRSVIFSNDFHLVNQHYSKHNKKYKLISTNKETGKKELVSSIVDDVGRKIAEANYQDILTLYNESAPTSKNLILNEEWSGKIIDLITDDPQLFQLISWYLNIRTKALNVSSFKLNDTLILFNLENQRLLKYPLVTHSVDSMSTKLKNVSNSGRVALDRGKNKFYYYDLSNVNLKIYQIDINTGQTKLIVQLDEIRYPKHIKFMNNSMFFTINNKVGSNSVYKIKI